MNHVLRITLAAGLLWATVSGCQRAAFQPSASRTAAASIYTHGAVAADHPLASQAGLEILQRGGNAVDAAVATSFCLSVVRPYSCGIGGGGFMMIHLTDDPLHGAVSVALDYRERAPRSITPDYYESLPDGASRYSGHAVAVPGTVSGLLHALQRYGSLDRATVLAPAIRIARDGFAVDDHTLAQIRKLQQFVAEGGHAATGQQTAQYLQRFVPADGVAVAGHIVRSPDQAAALQLIAAEGRSAFYEGPIADAVVSAVSSVGGVLDHSDLRAVRVKEVQPLAGEFLGRRLLCMPLPSSGGVTMLETLYFLEATRPSWDRQDQPAYLHALAEGLKHAFADRANWLGDPEYVEVPVDLLLDPGRLQRLAAGFDPQRTFAADHYGLPATMPTDGGTSHFSVVDAHGGAVACTETINLTFGSRVVVPGYGFCLNNQMDDFLTRRGEANAFGLQQSERNLPAPGKRPLSSMSPTIVLDDTGRVLAVAGGSGGPRIITGTIQALLNVLLFDRSASHAVSAARIHHQWAPDVLYVEDDSRRAIAGSTAHQLTRRGHRVKPTTKVGMIQLIRRSSAGWQAASDPRKGGAAAGY